MRNISAAVVFLSLSVVALYGQTQTIAVVSSSYTVTVPQSFTGTMFSTSSIGVSYPVGLSPSSYISGTQLNTDFQSFLTSYSNPNDPLEAILGSVLQSILNKYPQMTGGTLFGEIAGPGMTISGITLPGPPLGTVSVAIGTYNPATGVITGLNRNAGTMNSVVPGKPAKPVTPEKPVSTR